MLLLDVGAGVVVVVILEVVGDRVVEVLVVAADVVLGVSGGTIAFISGFYLELIDSIINFNFSVVKGIKKNGLNNYTEIFTNPANKLLPPSSRSLPNHPFSSLRNQWTLCNSTSLPCAFNPFWEHWLFM